MTVERPFLTTLPITVKTYDVDFAMIVHNAVYIRWLEDLRTQLLADYLPIEEIIAGGVSPILTRTEIDYKWPVRLGDAVNGRMWVSDLSKTRWTVQAELTVGEKICAAAMQLGYFANLKTLRPARIPEKLQQAWNNQAAGD